MKKEEILEELTRIKNELNRLIEAMDYQEEKGEPIRFADKRLEGVVREALGREKGEIFSQELQNIEELDVRNRRVVQLQGIEQLVNLKVLNLNWNQIKDLSPIQGLKSLKTLKLWGNQIEDISPLRQLENLKVLTLEDNRIRNIEPLKDLNNLKMLWLRKNQIQNIAPLLDNPGLGAGAKVFLDGDLFTFDSDSSVGQVIEQLMARGVIIYT